MLILTKRCAMIRKMKAFLAALCLLFAASALAQGAYPEQAVRIIVPFSPGVAPDVTSRLLAERLTAAWGKAVVVENITGAGGNIATGRLAKAPPDGYTLGMIGNSSLVFSPSLYEKLPFDPLPRHHCLAAGSAPRPSHEVVRQYRERAAAGARREAARLRRALDQAPRPRPCPPHEGGIGPPRLRSRALVRPEGARRYAAAN